MEEIAALRRAGTDEHAAQVRFLVADDDRLARSRLARSVGEIAGDILVLEAEDGTEAIQLGLQRDPDIALLAVTMRRLGGIEAAVTLRELHPHMRIGLHTEDPLAHRERARELHLPLFNKLELDRTRDWLQAEVERCIERRLGESERPPRRRFVCGVCGYGAVRAGAPDRCPMCHAERTWVEARWRPPRMVVSQPN